MKNFQISLILILSPDEEYAAQCCGGWHCPQKGPGSNLDWPFCVKFECSHRVCLGSPQVYKFF